MELTGYVKGVISFPLCGIEMTDTICHLKIRRFLQSEAVATHEIFHATRHEENIRMLQQLNPELRPLQHSSAISSTTNYIFKLQ
jgi:hypothetical protein